MMLPDGQKGVSFMKTIDVLAAGAGACALLAACSSGPSQASVQASQKSVQASHEKLACQDLVGATAEFGTMDTMLGQVQVTFDTLPAGYFTAAFTSAEQAVVHAPFKPTQAQVAALQRQCDSLGVTGNVWPTALTGET
jgi:hypothetical protein